MDEAIPLVILGAGGTAIDILDTLDDLNDLADGPRYDCRGFLDDKLALTGTHIHGRPVLGPLSLAGRLDGCRFVNGIGAPGTFWERAAILARTGIPPERFVTLCHPSATVSRTARLGRDVVLLQHVVIGADVEIGDHVVVLPNTVISHHAVVGDYTCVAGGVCVSGRARIGPSCYLGSNSAIVADVTVGEMSLVGMGSVVLRDVPPNSVVVGNPARFLRNTRPEAA